MAIPTKATVRSSYERIAAPFAASREEPWPEVLSFLERLPVGTRILDVGSGNGRHARAAAAGGHDVLAMDFARNLLQIARRGSRGRAWDRNIRWIQGEATTLPVRDGSVDACLCIALLHHLPSRAEQVRALGEIRRVLVRGGRVFVSVWALDQPRFRKVLAAQQELPREIRGDIEVPWTLPDGTRVPRYYHLFQEGELEELIIESGLHGERYFRAPGNIFAEATNHG